MIFLFFGSSIAHLEPKLQRFENLSLFVGISATPGWVWLPAPSVAEIPTSIDKFSNRCNLGSRWAIEDPKKRKIIRIWRWRWWSHQIRSNCESIVTQGRYSYLKNCFMQENCVFGHFLQKPSVPNFFSRWFWIVLSKAFQRCMTCQWYILFDLNFVLHHCAAPSRCGKVRWALINIRELCSLSPPPCVGASKELVDTYAWRGGGAAKGLVEVVSESDDWSNQHPGCLICLFTFWWIQTCLVAVNIFQSRPWHIGPDKIDRVDTATSD